jgi:hypothetical protein
MVLGMLPTALGRGMGSEFRAPMAIAVIGGVITSTMLTLWVVPVVFVWVERIRRDPGQKLRRGREWLRRRRSAAAAAPEPTDAADPGLAAREAERQTA